MRVLIKKHRKLLKVEAEKSFDHNTEDHFSEIFIVTDKGTYMITGCPACGALSWQKVERKTTKESKNKGRIL